MIQDKIQIAQKFENFNWWFEIISPHRYNIYCKEHQGDDVIWVCKHSNVDPDEIVEGAEWIADWENYKSRPEYQVTGILWDIDVDEIQLDELQDLYENLLVGSCYLRAINGFEFDPDRAWQRVEHCIEWLQSTDFYSAPASTRYHDSEPGGLVRHSIKVAKYAAELQLSSLFNSKTRLQDAVLVALIHDWCKIGLYEVSTRNVKDDATGRWTQVPFYKYRNTRLSCFGHGVSSLYLGQKFFQLSVQEALAVRWHQGRWNVCREEMNELQQANEMYPLVHLIQFADQLAVTRYS